LLGADVPQIGRFLRIGLSVGAAHCLIYVLMATTNVVQRFFAASAFPFLHAAILSICAGVLLWLCLKEISPDFQRWRILLLGVAIEAVTRLILQLVHITVTQSGAGFLPIWMVPWMRPAENAFHFSIIAGLFAMLSGRTFSFGNLMTICVVGAFLYTFVAEGVLWFLFASNFLSKWFTVAGGFTYLLYHVVMSWVLWYTSKTLVRDSGNGS
jgi:hypothetical protein